MNGFNLFFCKKKTHNKMARTVYFKGVDWPTFTENIKLALNNFSSHNFSDIHSATKD